jgi:hypothetical protein
MFIIDQENQIVKGTAKARDIKAKGLVKASIDCFELAPVSEMEQ